MTFPTGVPYSRPRPGDTPTPDTARTARLRAQVRADIEPNSRWWQFAFQPWHYWTAIASTAAMFAAVIVFLTVGGTTR